MLTHTHLATGWLLAAAAAVVAAHSAAGMGSGAAPGMAPGSGCPAQRVCPAGHNMHACMRLSAGWLTVERYSVQLCGMMCRACAHAKHVLCCTFASTPLLSFSVLVGCVGAAHAPMLQTHHQCCCVCETYRCGLPWSVHLAQSLDLGNGLLLAECGSFDLHGARTAAQWVGCRAATAVLHSGS